MAPTRFKNVEISEAELSFTADGSRRSFPRATLPAAFMEWMLTARRAMYDHLEGEGRAAFFAAHLPVVVTSCRHRPVPFNTGNKGVGVLPVEDKLDHYAGLYQEAFDRASALPWEESRPLRLEAVRGLMASSDVSDRALVTLEIFEKQTFANLCDFPVATLHYTDVGPVYRSFQIDAVVEIVTPEHPAYRFAYLSRALFEHDSFHLTQTRFPYAYLFHPTEVRDKTPYRRRPAKD